MIATIALCALISTSAGGEELPDLITLGDGKQIECRVLYEDASKVIYRAGRKETEIVRSTVKDLQTVERSLRELLDQMSQADMRDPKALAGLAEFAEGRYLPAEAHDLWIRVLTVDPENEQAWTKLGGIHARKGWQIKVGGRFYGLEELRERVSDWKHALELPTAHFLIRTDGDPARALDLAVDVERAFFAFYDLLGPALGLYYAWEEVPEIHIFTDEKDAPNPPVPGDTAWYSIGENTLYVRVTENRDPGPAVAEFVDLLIYNSFRRTLDVRSGAIAPWARTGLRTAFAGGVQTDPGKVSFDLKSPIMGYFKSQAQDEEPADLDKLLNAGFGAFETGTDAPRFVAQGYTFTYFLAFAQDQKYRPGLARFLLSSFQGQGAATHLKKILDVDLKKLEAEWIAYVKQVAGA
jgi:hypothetical protein